MPDYDLVARSDRAVLPAGVGPAAVAVKDGRIALIAGRDVRVSARRDVDFGADALLPGLVDSHVHVDEPGRTDWEGFATATAAAAAGGVTAIVDMPLNSLPPTVSVAALKTKQDAARGKAVVDVGFWGGAVPENQADLEPLWDAGVFGFKSFLAPSGVEEFPPLPWSDVEDVMTLIAGFSGLLIVHAEDGESLGEPAGPTYADFLASRPPAVEDSAVSRLVGVAAATGARTHVLHLSSASAVPVLASARAAGVRVSAETCPHYLTLAAESVEDGRTDFKCCPPIRDQANADALWAGLAAGTIGCVVSDHSPCPAELKAGGFDTAWGGISSLQLGLPVVWTEAARRGIELETVVGWMSDGPARLAGLWGKGRLVAGADADLVRFDPEATWTVDPGRLHHRHPVTPYAGKQLRGAVRTTWLAGREVDGEPVGRLLRRGER